MNSEHFMSLDVISNIMILGFEILGGFIKLKSLTLCKLSKQGI